MTPLTLRTRLTLFYTAVLALLVTGLSFSYYRILGLQLDADATADLREITDGMHGYLHIVDGAPVLAYDRTDPEQAAFIDAASRYYQVYDVATGRLLVQSRALQPLGLQYTRAEVDAFRSRPRTIDVQTDRGRIRLSNSVITPASGETYLLQVGVALDAVDVARTQMLRLLLWSVPASLIIVVVTGRWMAGRSLAPLAALVAKTRAIDVADLRQRLPVRGAHDELDAVADAFNETLGRLEHAVGEMRQFSAAIAHELRTPLAALRGETELALLHAASPDEFRRSLASQLEEFDTLTRLINQLLTLARAEAGEIALAHDPVDVAALAGSVVEQLVPVAQARGLDLTCDAPAAVIVAGDTGWLERLLLNLLDNAIKFTAPGGRITVTVARQDGDASLAISDTGVGIAPGALPRIFERFYREDPARSSEGAGLGLSLVKWIIDRHGGSIAVASRPGAGTTFTARLPLAPTGSA